MMIQQKDAWTCLPSISSSSLSVANKSKVANGSCKTCKATTIEGSLRIARRRTARLSDTRTYKEAATTSFTFITSSSPSSNNSSNTSDADISDTINVNVIASTDVHQVQQKALCDASPLLNAPPRPSLAVLRRPTLTQQRLIPSIVSRGKDALQRQAHKVRLREKADRMTSILTKSPYFIRLVDWAYGVCDPNRTGHIGKSELYAGLLLVHVQLAKFAGPAACFPPPRTAVNELFDCSDVDHSGGIDRDEFNIIMNVSCAHVLTRIGIAYAANILVLPFVSQWIVRNCLFWKDSVDIGHETCSINYHDPMITTTGDTFDCDAIYAQQEAATWWIFPLNTNMVETIAERLVATILFLLLIPVLFRRIDHEATSAAGRKAERRRSILVTD